MLTLAQLGFRIPGLCEGGLEQLSPSPTEAAQALARRGGQEAGSPCEVLCILGKLMQVDRSP